MSIGSAAMGMMMLAIIGMAAVTFYAVLSSTFNRITDGLMIGLSMLVCVGAAVATVAVFAR